MALKNIDNADPKILEYWMSLKDFGCIPKLFEKKAAASIRTQLGRYRTLAAKQARWFYEEIQDFSLISRLDVASGKYGIYVDEATPLPSLDGFTARCAYVPRTKAEREASFAASLASVQAHAQAPTGTPASLAPAYNPQEHHHNPIELSPTGIPLQMPETFPPQAAQALAPLSEEERKRIEREEDRQRNLDLLKKLGFDKPLKRNDERDNPGDNE